MALHPYLSICAGIGGLDLGIDLATGGSARSICYVENELSAVEVLASRMSEQALPAAPIWSDARTFDAGAWRGKVEGIVAGYPCQPFSTASPHRLGTEDVRNLWPDVLRIAGDSGASWLFLENVEAHLSTGYLDVVRPELEDAGFRCSEQIIGASDAGLPHPRKRLFILAVADSFGGDGRITKPAGLDIAGWESEAERDGGMDRASNLADADGAMGAESILSRLEAQGWNAIVDGRSDLDWFQHRIPGPGELQAWREIAGEHPEIVPARQPHVRRGPHGTADELDLPDAVRISLIGNAVVPQQAALAWLLLWSERT